MDAEPISEPIVHSGLRFNPEVNAGHLLTMITMICTIIGMWFAFDKRLAIIDEKMLSTRDQVANIALAVKQNSESQVQVARTMDKLSFIVEELQKKK